MSVTASYHIEEQKGAESLVEVASWDNGSRYTVTMCVNDIETIFFCTPEQMTAICRAMNKPKRLKYR